MASIIWACFSKKLALKALEFVLDIAESLSSGNLDAFVIIKSPSGKLILAADACAIALRMLLRPLPIAWLRDYVDLFLVVYDWLLIDIGCFEDITLPSLAAWFMSIVKSPKLRLICMPFIGASPSSLAVLSIGGTRVA